jgi:hypothetical protein
MVPLKVKASVDPDGVNLNLPVDRPMLRVTGNPPGIQGLGLEQMDVTVSAPNAGGRTVTLNPTRGKLGKSTVTLDDSGIASTTLRSIGTGPVTITAVSDGLTKGDSEGLEFLFPWRFVIAAISGGLIGALIGILQSRSRLPGLKRILIRLAAGALAGTAVAAFYTIGVNVTPIAPTATAGEALVFGLAIAGGFLGLKIPRRA